MVIKHEFLKNFGCEINFVLNFQSQVPLNPAFGCEEYKYLLMKSYGS